MEFGRTTASLPWVARMWPPQDPPLLPHFCAGARDLCATLDRLSACIRDYSRRAGLTDRASYKCAYNMAERCEHRETLQTRNSNDRLCVCVCVCVCVLVCLCACVWVARK